MGEIQLLKELQKGIIAWYDFAQFSNVLYIGDEKDAIAEYLKSNLKGISITVASLEESKNVLNLKKLDIKFDYIICIHVIEKILDIAAWIKSIRVLTAPNAVFLLGMNNRFGIRYFCGDRDEYTNRNFDCIEGYRSAYRKSDELINGRMYSKAEIKQMLELSGVRQCKFYSILSDLNNPILLYAEGYKPKEDITTRLYPVYNSPDTIFLEEELLYKTLVDNGIFHEMANAYLVEFSVDECAILSDALQISSSMVRSAQDSMLTIIHSSGIVEKVNVYPEGRDRLCRMIEYADDLSQHGLKVVEMQLTDRGIKMPYIEAPTGQLYLKELYLTDINRFLKALDYFCNHILKSSDVIDGDANDEQGATLRYGYLDLVPLNSFYLDGDFVFFDQEFREENYPANAIIARMVSTFYAGNFALQNVMTRDELYDRYNLMPRIGEWRKYETDFLTKLRNDNDLKDYYNRVRKNGAIVAANRQRINFSTDDYYRFFINIFDKADTRKLILFGSGNFAKSFFELYADNYPVFAVIDNNQSKWGEEIYGVKIHSPEYLRELSSGEYKVMICVKDYLPIMNQLDDMGITEYSVYDSKKVYPRKNNPIVEASESFRNSNKKYHIGYIAGVFDLFHVGHLNMFKRAKEQCDYLIVGVVTDEGALKHNHKKTFVPFDERIEMVRSCRYVDEAVKIPIDKNDTKEAFEMYHFDVQFSGSDYINNQRWLDKQKYLREHGADLVFFSYTQSTCSTNLKALIEKGLAE